jgi:hypothetical protein
MVPERSTSGFARCSQAILELGLNLIEKHNLSSAGTAFDFDR